MEEFLNNARMRSPHIRFASTATRWHTASRLSLLAPLALLFACSQSPPTESDVRSLLEKQSEGAKIVGLKVNSIASIETEPFPCGGRLGTHGPTFKVNLEFTNDLGTCEKRGLFIPVPGHSCGQPYLKGVMCVEKADSGWTVASTYLTPGFPPSPK